MCGAGWRELGGSGDGALSPDEGGSEVGAACSCPRAEMTCREGCSSEVWQRSDCARGLHLGWRKSNKEAPGELSGPCRDKLDRHTGPKLCRDRKPTTSHLITMTDTSITQEITRYFDIL